MKEVYSSNQILEETIKDVVPFIFSYFKHNYYNTLSLNTITDSSNQILEETIKDVVPFINKDNNRLIKLLADHIYLKISSLKLDNLEIDQTNIEDKIKSYYQQNEKICAKELLNEILCSIFFKLENNTNDKKFNTFTTEELNTQLDNLLTNKIICPDTKNILILNYLSNLKNSLNGINDININLNKLESLYKDFLIINQNKNNIFVNNLRILFTKFIIEINLANLLLPENIQYTYNVSIMEAIRTFKANAYEAIQKIINSDTTKINEIEFNKCFSTKIDEKILLSVNNQNLLPLDHSTKNINYLYQLYDHIINYTNNKQLQSTIKTLTDTFNEKIVKLKEKAAFENINKITKLDNQIPITELGDQITKLIDNYQIKNKNNLNLDILHKEHIKKELKETDFLKKYFADIISLQHRRIIINQLFNTKDLNELNLIYTLLLNINNTEVRFFQQNNNIFKWYKHETLISISDLNGTLGDLFIKQNNKNHNNKIQIDEFINYCQDFIALTKNTVNKISNKSSYLNQYFKKPKKIKETNINKHIDQLNNIMNNIRNTQRYSSYDKRYIDYKTTIGIIINNINNDLTEQNYQSFFKEENNKLFKQNIINCESKSLKVIISNILFLFSDDNANNELIIEGIYNKIASLTLYNIKISKDQIKLVVDNYLAKNKNKNVDELLGEILNDLFLEKNQNNYDKGFIQFTSDQLTKQFEDTFAAFNNQNECQYLKNLRLLNYLSNLRNKLDEINIFIKIVIDLNKFKSLYKKFLNTNQTENNIFINKLRVLFTEFMIEINARNLLLEENIKYTYYLSLLEAVKDFQIQAYEFLIENNYDIQICNNIIQEIISSNIDNSPLKEIHEATNSQEEQSILLNDITDSLETHCVKNDISIIEDNKTKLNNSIISDTNINNKKTLNNTMNISNEYTFILDEINNSNENSLNNISKYFNEADNFENSHYDITKSINNFKDDYILASPNKNDNNESFNSLLDCFEEINIKIKKLYNLFIENISDINNSYQGLIETDKFNEIRLTPNKIFEQLNNIILTINTNNIKQTIINFNTPYNQEILTNLKNIINISHLKLIGDNLFSNHHDHLIDEIIGSINSIENLSYKFKGIKYDNFTNLINRSDIKESLLNLIKKNKEVITNSLEDNYVNHNFSIIPIISNKDNNKSNLVLSMLPMHQELFNKTITTITH